MRAAFESCICHRQRSEPDGTRKRTHLNSDMKLTPRRVLLLQSIIALVASPAAAQIGAEASASRPSKNIVQTAMSAGQFETLLTAAKAAGLVETLSGNNKLTVFAPTDAAFDKLPKGTVASLLADKKKLAQILTYHVVAGEMPAKKVVGQSWIKTVQGQSVRVAAGEKGVMVDGAKILKTDITASNGVIHVIDSVILPRADIVDTAVEAGSFKTLVTAVKAAGLVDVLKGDGPFTVFAPTDEAFAALPAGTIPALLKDKKKLGSILTFHVVKGRVLAEDLPMAKNGKVSAEPSTVQGQKLSITRSKDGKVTVNGANVVSANIIAGNGVIHVIDKVVLPK